MKRKVLSLSLSETNPDAQRVLEAFADLPPGRRSAELLRWAAAYLSGEAGAPAEAVPALGLSDEELDALLDDF